jgi:hypothetical protein
MEPLSFGRELGAIKQVSFVVDDIEREMDHWSGTLGVGPFFYLRHFPLLDATYRNDRTAIDVDVALAFTGSTCIEFIRQNGDAPSPFREWVTARGYGFHHFGLFTRTLDAELSEHTRRGAKVFASATVAIGGRCAYLETESPLGSVLELIEVTPPVEQFFSMIHGAARSWDGTDPVRRLGP